MRAITLNKNLLFTSTSNHKCRGLPGRARFTLRAQLSDIDEATHRFNAEVMPILMQRIRGLKVSEIRVKAFKDVIDEHIAMRPPVPNADPGFSQVEWNILDNWHQDAWKALRKAEEDIQSSREVSPRFPPDDLRGSGRLRRMSTHTNSSIEASLFDAG